MTVRAPLWNFGRKYFRHWQMSNLWELFWLINHWRDLLLKKNCQESYSRQLFWLKKMNKNLLTKAFLIENLLLLTRAFFIENWVKRYSRELFCSKIAKKSHSRELSFIKNCEESHSRKLFLLKVAKKVPQKSYFY